MLRSSFTQKDKDFLLLKNGPCCNFCSKAFFKDDKEFDLSSFKLFFYKIRNKSTTVLKPEIACIKCYQDIGLFVNCFVIEGLVDDTFLLSYYVYTFAVNPNHDLRLRHSLLPYALNRTQFDDTFFKFLFSCEVKSKELYLQYINTKT